MSRRRHFKQRPGGAHGTQQTGGIREYPTQKKPGGKQPQAPEKALGLSALVKQMKDAEKVGMTRRAQQLKSNIDGKVLKEWKRVDSPSYRKKNKDEIRRQLIQLAEKLSLEKALKEMEYKRQILERYGRF